MGRRILALDLSMTSTGFALWGEDGAKVAIGSWQLGSEYSTVGQVFKKLHERMSEICAFGGVDHIFYEEPLALSGFNTNSNARAHFLAVGLAAHAESFATAYSARAHPVGQSTWRAAFYGKIAGRVKAAKGATPILKAMSLERARQYGFKPRTHDEADAIGVLDYGIAALGIESPWRAEYPILPQLVWPR